MGSRGSGSLAWPHHSREVQKGAIAHLRDEPVVAAEGAEVAPTQRRLHGLDADGEGGIVAAVQRAEDRAVVGVELEQALEEDPACRSCGDRSGR